jgi:hypothetical protein
MEFYSAIRKNETMWLKGKWMQLEDIMLREEVRLRKTKVTCFPFYVRDRHNTNISNIVKNRLL